MKIILEWSKIPFQLSRNLAPFGGSLLDIYPFINIKIWEHKNSLNFGLKYSELSSLGLKVSFSINPLAKREGNHNIFVEKNL